MPTPAARHTATDTPPESATLDNEQATEQAAEGTAVTVEQIAAMLRELGEAVEVDGDLVVIACEADGRSCPLALDLANTGGLLRFYFPEFLPSLPRALGAELMRELLDLNQRSQLLKYGSIGGSGRIWVDLAIPTEDAGITRRQLSRCLELMRHALEVQRPYLLQLMQTDDEAPAHVGPVTWKPFGAPRTDLEAFHQEPVLAAAQHLCDELAYLWSYYIDRDRIGEARETLAWALAVAQEPESVARCEVVLGQLCEQWDEFEEAIGHYRRAVAAKPTHPHRAYFAHNNLGYCLNLSGEYEEAEQLCRTAIQIDPQRHNAYKNLGIALEGLGRLSEAASCYVDAVRRCPQDDRALGLLEQLCKANPGLLVEAPRLAEDLEECRRLSEAPPRRCRSRAPYLRGPSVP